MALRAAVQSNMTAFSLMPPTGGQQDERLPDDPKADKNRNLFANGPEGMLIFAREGPHLGAIDLGQVTSNCDWSDDGSVLYISADMYLLRIKTSTKGAGW